MGRAARARRAYEDAVAYLCHNADAVRGMVEPDRWDASYPVVREGDPATEEWREAVRALHDAAEAAGIPGGLGLRPTLGPGDWPSGPTPRSAGWVCPTGRCARVDLRDGPEAGRETPRCALTGRAMRLVGG